MFRLPVIHTREGHRPDLSDCPAVKFKRGKKGMRIGDMVIGKKNVYC